MTERLPELGAMVSTANDMIGLAVQERMPSSVTRLVDGMKPGILDLLTGGVPSAEVKGMAVDHITKVVASLDPSSVDAAVAHMSEYIDSATSTST